MKNTMRMMTLLAAMMTLTACDYIEQKQFDKERRTKTYQDAMIDFSAGRLDQAERGFVKTLKNNPGHASAMFQLACLLEEHKKDYLGAMCLFREYELFEDGDKVMLAKKHVEDCKRKFIDSLKVNANGAKLGLPSAEDIKSKDDKISQLKKQLEDVTAQLARSKEECARIRHLITAPDDEEDLKKTTLPDDKALLEDDDDAGSTDRVKMSEDIAKLRLEEDSEVKATPFKVMPKVEKKEPVKVQPNEPLHETKPDRYVVAEGDTLSRIALRFYGNRSAWKRIREANKTVISMDGRVKSGTTIVLP